jgi:hypothetical protein
MRELQSMRHDRHAYINLARDRIRQIEAIMRKDLDERPQPTDDAWDLAAAMRRMDAQNEAEVLDEAAQLGEPSDASDSR